MLSIGECSSERHMWNTRVWTCLKLRHTLCAGQRWNLSCTSHTRTKASRPGTGTGSVSDFPASWKSHSTKMLLQQVSWEENAGSTMLFCLLRAWARQRMRQKGMWKLQMENGSFRPNDETKSKPGKYRGETVNSLPVRLRVTVPVSSHGQEKLTEIIQKIREAELPILSSLSLL